MKKLLQIFTKYDMLYSNKVHRHSLVETKEELAMAFCKNCGKEIDDKAVVCPACGVPQQDKPAVVDSGNIGWAFLGCCIPLVGLILFLVWKDQKPNTAKKAGIGALVGVILIVIYYVVVIAAGVGMAMIQ